MNISDHFINDPKLTHKDFVDLLLGCRDYNQVLQVEEVLKGVDYLPDYEMKDLYKWVENRKEAHNKQ